PRSRDGAAPAGAASRRKRRRRHACGPVAPPYGDTAAEARAALCVGGKAGGADLAGAERS
ncbi:hypothetical protein, partial [Burkholderia pseudomultivorans]